MCTAFEVNSLNAISPRDASLKKKIPLAFQHWQQKAFHSFFLVTTAAYILSAAKPFWSSCVTDQSKQTWKVDNLTIAQRNISHSCFQHTLIPPWHKVMKHQRNPCKKASFTHMKDAIERSQRATSAILPFSILSGKLRETSARVLRNNSTQYVYVKRAVVTAALICLKVVVKGKLSKDGKGTRFAISFFSLSFFKILLLWLTLTDRKVME